jgi:DNA-binding NarL/FixJ family response regulator
VIVSSFDGRQTLSFVIRERQQERVKQLNIVIAEDSKILRDRLQQTLSVIAGFNIVGIAMNGVEAIWLIKELKPHVLILDVTMPLKDGIQTTKEIRKDDSSTVIIIFTGDPNPFLRKTCLEAGANYFLHKSWIVELIEICNRELLAH